MNLARLEGKLVVASERVGIPVYDFDFDLRFQTTHPVQFRPGERCVLRVGAIQDYAQKLLEFERLGLKLVHTAEEYLRASELEAWYPLIEDLTPRSKVFAEFPPAAQVAGEFGWPVFVKGSRQTSRHNPELSVITDETQYDRLRSSWLADPILRWQKPVIRQFVPLEPVQGAMAGKLRPSVEFRSFWWRGQCVGWGQYWHEVDAYPATGVEAGLDLAKKAVERLKVPFLVVDIARTKDGRWIVIECNDGQESGYASVNPMLMWRQILDSIQPQTG